MREQPPIDSPGTNQPGANPSEAAFDATWPGEAPANDDSASQRAAKHWVESQKEGNTVVSPSTFWWVSVFGPIAFVFFLAFVPGAYKTARKLVPLPPRSLFRVLALVLAAVHAGEAAYAYQLAKKHGLDARGWASQTFVIGFPSILELKKQIDSLFD